MAKELIRVPRVLGESYNSVLIERLYEAGGNVMLDLIISYTWAAITSKTCSGLPGSP